MAGKSPRLKVVAAITVLKVIQSSKLIRIIGVNQKLKNK